MKEINEKELTLISNFKVTSADADIESRVRPGAFVNYLVQSAINSANSLGFGFDVLQKQQLFWVLSRLTIEIYQPVKWNNDVEVETWPKGTEGIFYLRDFLVRDKEQHVIARATSGWLAIDIETKRPKILDSNQAEIFTHLKDKHGLNELPEKLPKVKEGEITEIRSYYSDIDLNKHVTSTRYIDWMMDTLPLDFLRNHYPKRLSINYLKETKPGETIRVLHHQSGNAQFHFEGFNLSTQTNSFRGRIDF